METKLIKKMMSTGILLLTSMSICAQQVNEGQHTVVPIDSIYLKKGNHKLALNDVTTNSIQSLLGKPINVNIYEEKWSDECDKITTYEYELLTIRFWSLENEEWLHYTECSNPEISIVIDKVCLYTGVKDSVLSIFEQSWRIYQELENTKEYQDKIKRGNTEKVFIMRFPIKKESYEYLGLIYFRIKDGNIMKIEFFVQDEA